MSDYSLYRPELREQDAQPRVSAYYFRQWVGFQMPFHSHHSVEIMYVMEGSCTIAFEEASVPMKKGEFIFIDADLLHRLLVDTGKSCRMLNVEFTFDEPTGGCPTLRQVIVENLPLASMLEERRPYFELKDSGEVFHTLKSLVLELDERGAVGNMMVQLLLSQFMIQMGRLAFDAWHRTGQQSADGHIKQALHYLQQHYDCDIQVKDVAGAVGLHPGYLHRLFKLQTGQSVMEYLTSLRVDKAKMLLAQTEIPVAEIPDYIGVNSRPYFNVVFKKNTGTTPAQYRKTFEKQRREFT